MKDELITDTLKELFRINILNGELDGGQFIEDTTIYKIVYDSVKSYKPTKANTIEGYCFDFAVKTAANELYQRGNHWMYQAEAYRHLFEDQLTYLNIDTLVGLCSYYGLLKGFGETNLNYGNDKGLVNNKKTTEVISFDNIKALSMKMLEYQLSFQINIIKIVLSGKEHRNEIINMLAGGEKDENIESATAILDDLMKI